jgi:hypothetical protein
MGQIPYSASIGTFPRERSRIQLQRYQASDSPIKRDAQGFVSPQLNLDFGIGRDILIQKEALKMTRSRRTFTSQEKGAIWFQHLVAIAQVWRTPAGCDCDYANIAVFCLLEFFRATTEASSQSALRSVPISRRP